LSRADEQLGALQRSLGRAVGDAYVAALAVAEPAGTSDAWQAVLARHGVAPAGAVERAKVAAATGMTHGAPVDDLRQVLEAIAKAADAELRVIDTDGYAEERRWRRLQTVIGDLRDDTLAAYRKQVMPARGMFAGALASAQRARPAAAGHRHQQHVLRCPNCAAPRLDQAELVCDYCDHRFAGGGPPGEEVR
jgi:hypothetical protein